MLVIELKFSKFNDTPWGFRLTGGADFEYPLTVIKVTEGSLAAEAGMHLGDVVVRINDTPTSNLTHLEAHHVILAAGNNFVMAVQREEEVHAQEVITAAEPSIKEVSNKQETEQIPPAADGVPEIPTGDIVVSDDQIAEIISSEAEVLKEHNVIGVNFNKIIPQALSLKTSEVFKTLNAEAVKTKEEKIQEERRWTTFLQKPNRPIPKSKFDIEQEKREVYKVKIVKQPKPRIAPDRIPTPDPVQMTPDPKEDCTKNEIKAEVESAPEQHQEENVTGEEEIDLKAEDVEELVKSTADDEVPDLEVPQEEAQDPDELSRELEEKLVDVQKQLLALSNLPSTIKATLDAVTEQLSKIVPVAKEEEEQEVVQEVVEESNLAEEKIENEISPEDHEVSEIHADLEEGNIEKAENLEDLEHQYEENIATDEKETETEAELEHQQRLIHDRTPKIPPKPKLTSAFGPLVPQERPIFLPGGRKWRKPKDAFNEEFIAEVLSSQAEIITGTTLGVNFLKYQKPEKKVDLRNSEVYRMIHRMDKEPTTGIAVRPEKVLTVDDVRRCSSPLSKCGQ